MDITRARDINARLCTAYFVAEGIMDRPMPDLSDVSLAEALEASRSVAGDIGEVRPDGTTVFTCHVSERAIPCVLAAAIKARAIA